ncbi:GntR family transcriptional regulator [Ktedonosporobacter rubrisoli]|nr:GntR family transcriptional regulator [Ktedonosporobacter rubrisoli]
MSLENTRPILKKTALPRYYQLKEIIRAKIRSQEWQPGDLLPSERELGELYGISRMTARQAVSELVSEGILYRERGIGTFVSQVFSSQQTTRLTGFTELVEAQGQKARTKVLVATLRPANLTSARQFRIKVGQPIFYMRRLRLVNWTPVVLERGCISFNGCEQLLEEDLEQNSLFQLLETKYGLPPLKSEHDLDIGRVGVEESGYLNLPIGSPVHIMHGTIYTEHDLPIVDCTSIYRNTSIKLVRQVDQDYPVYAFHDVR